MIVVNFYKDSLSAAFDLSAISCGEYENYPSVGNKNSDFKKTDLDFLLYSICRSDVENCLFWRNVCFQQTDFYWIMLLEPLSWNLFLFVAQSYSGSVPYLVPLHFISFEYFSIPLFTEWTTDYISSLLPSCWLVPVSWIHATIVCASELST